MNASDLLLQNKNDTKACSSDPSSYVKSLFSGFLKGNYTVLRVLSRSSPVFLCREDASDRHLVLKFFLSPDYSRFLRETKMLSQLEHYPSHPKLLFAQSQVDFAVIGLQYCTGRSLIELAGKGNLESLKALQHAAEKQLHLLHSKWSVAHGDLSPKNIWIKDSQEVLFLDWECAQTLHTASIDQYSQNKGTIGFSDSNLNHDLRTRDFLALQKSFSFIRGEENTEKASTVAKDLHPKTWDRIKKWLKQN